MDARPRGLAALKEKKAEREAERAARRGGASARPPTAVAVPPRPLQSSTNDGDKMALLEAEEKALAAEEAALQAAEDKALAAELKALEAEEMAFHEAETKTQQTPKPSSRGSGAGGSATAVEKRAVAPPRPPKANVAKSLNTRRPPTSSSSTWWRRLLSSCVALPDQFPRDCSACAQAMSYASGVLGRLCSQYTLQQGGRRRWIVIGLMVVVVIGLGWTVASILSVAAAPMALAPSSPPATPLPPNAPPPSTPPDVPPHRPPPWSPPSPIPAVPPFPMQPLPGLPPPPSPPPSASPTPPPVQPPVAPPIPVPPPPSPPLPSPLPSPTPHSPPPLPSPLSSPVPLAQPGSSVRLRTSSVPSPPPSLPSPPSPPPPPSPSPSPSTTADAAHLRPSAADAGALPLSSTLHASSRSSVPLPSPPSPEDANTVSLAPSQQLHATSTTSATLRGRPFHQERTWAVGSIPPPPPALSAPPSPQPRTHAADEAAAWATIAPSVVYLVAFMSALLGAQLSAQLQRCCPTEEAAKQGDTTMARPPTTRAALHPADCSPIHPYVQLQPVDSADVPSPAVSGRTRVGPPLVRSAEQRVATAEAPCASTSRSPSLPSPKSPRISNVGAALQCTPAEPQDSRSTGNDAWLQQLIVVHQHCYAPPDSVDRAGSEGDDHGDAIAGAGHDLSTAVDVRVRANGDDRNDVGWQERIHQWRDEAPEHDSGDDGGGDVDDLGAFRSSETLEGDGAAYAGAQLGPEPDWIAAAILASAAAAPVAQSGAVGDSQVVHPPPWSGGPSPPPYECAGTASPHARLEEGEGGDFGPIGTVQCYMSERGGLVHARRCGGGYQHTLETSSIASSPRTPNRSFACGGSDRTPGTPSSASSPHTPDGSHRALSLHRGVHPHQHSASKEIPGGDSKEIPGGRSTRKAEGSHRSRDGGRASPASRSYSYMEEVHPRYDSDDDARDTPAPLSGMRRSVYVDTPPKSRSPLSHASSPRSRSPRDHRQPSFAPIPMAFPLLAHSPQDADAAAWQYEESATSDRSSVDDGTPWPRGEAPRQLRNAASRGYYHCVPSRHGRRDRSSISV